MTTTTQVFIVADCSGSMWGAPEIQMRKSILEAITALAANEPGQRFDVQLCPFSAQVRLEMPYAASELTRRPEVLARVNTGLPFGGQTALLDAIGRCLEEAEKTIKTTPALIMVFTDGQENTSYVWNTGRITGKIGVLEATGNLTLTVAGPKSVGDMMTRLGLPAGNFRAWDGTVAELKKVATDTTTALDKYAKSRGAGQTSAGRFYADASALTVTGIKANTAEVTPKATDTVSKRMAGRTIADFFGAKFVQGNHFYELVKAEYIQEDKDLVVHVKATGEFRIGARSVRTLLGLPETGRIRVHPSTNASPYTIFVRSESNNRKVVEGQRLLTVEA